MGRRKKVFSLYVRRIKLPGKRTPVKVYYYRTYDAQGNRTVGRSTGKETVPEAEAYCRQFQEREGARPPTIPLINQDSKRSREETRQSLSFEKASFSLASKRFPPVVSCSIPGEKGCLKIRRSLLSSF